METLRLIAPELFIVATSGVLLMYGVFARGDRSTTIRFIAAGLLVAFALVGFFLGAPEGELFSGALKIDLFGHYAKMILGFTAAAALIFGLPFFRREKLDTPEFPILVMEAALGMSIMISANNLLTLYIGVELQALCLYLMAATNRDSLRSSEAGLKYFILGALSSGILLYGISLVYGFTGTIRFDTLALVLATEGANLGVVAGLVFLLSGLAFKISAAPFHMWTPDVYEGSPTPVTAFFATGPKFAAMALIARVLVDPFGSMVDDWQQIIAIFAVLSMFVGVLGAIAQTNIKRLMAYSSITNMGYALVALSAGTAEGVSGMLIFMTIYVVTNIGVFAAILQMRTHTGMVERVEDLSGLSRTNTGLAIVITLLMFNLVGIMPLGFVGKFFAFTPAVDVGLWWLALAALVASVIGAFYYIRVVKTIWFDEQQTDFVVADRLERGFATTAAVLVFPLLLVPFVFAPSRELISNAALSLFI